MFAVIKTGGKQYKVAAEDTIKIEKIAGDAGETVTFEEVLMVGGETDFEVGTPLVDGASVAGEVVEQTRAKKIIVFKKKRRKNHRRTKGHRQEQTVVRITDILTGGKAPAKQAAKKAEPKPEPKQAPKAEAEDEAPAAAAPMFAAPEGAADDLKKISGVGPVLEGKLNGLGITKYEQIVALSADEIAKIDEELNFKGRIERDGWLDQAKALAAGVDPKAE